MTSRQLGYFQAVSCVVIGTRLPRGLDFFRTIGTECLSNYWTESANGGECRDEQISVISRNNCSISSFFLASATSGLQYTVTSKAMSSGSFARHKY